MNHARTIGQGNVVIAHYIECLLVLSLTDGCGTVEKRLIFFVFQILSRVSLNNFVGRAAAFLVRQIPKNCVKKSLGHIIGISICCLHLSVGLNRVHAQAHIAGKGPGRGGPCQNIGILPLHLESGNG